MTWPLPRYSRSQVSKAGDFLAKRAEIESVETLTHAGKEGGGTQLRSQRGLQVGRYLCLASAFAAQHHPQRLSSCRGLQLRDETAIHGVIGKLGLVGTIVGKSPAEGLTVEVLALLMLPTLNST